MPRIPTVHIIYRLVPHPAIRDRDEIVGVVTAGWEEADALVEALNLREAEGVGFDWRRNYWKVEVEVLTRHDAARLEP